MLTNEMKQYARYLLKSNKRLCAILWVTLFVVMPFLLEVLGVMSDDMQGLKFYTLFIGCALACLTPIYLFRFIYQKRSSDLYFSLPMKRTHIFFVTFFTGFFTILIPVLINFLLSNPLQYGIKGMIINIVQIIVIIFSLYGIVTWAVQQCNNLLDSIFISWSYIFLPLLFIGAFSVFMNNQFTSFMVGGGSFVDEIPLLRILPKGISIVYNNLLMQDFMTRSIDRDWFFLLYWLIICIVCIWFANKSFTQRKQEDSEQRTSVWWTYPLMIGILTFCLILMIVNVNTDIETILITSIAIFVLYICMIFFSKRKIKLTMKSVTLFMALYIGCFSFSLIFQKTDGFHIVKEVPTLANIKSVNIMVNSEDYENNEIIPFEIRYKDSDNKEKKIKLSSFNAEGNKDEEISEIIKIQKNFIEAREHTDSSNTYAYMEYNLKNGKTIYREYYLNKDIIIKEIENILNSNATGDTSYKLQYSQNENGNS